MRLLLVSPAFVLLAACGSGTNDPDQNIMNATAQMDPAAASAVENATAQGVDPQNALAIGGEAATFANEPSAADRKDGTTPPADGPR
ncbi:hypothetical protein GGQ97_001226 [Sphingomonas kaistensis]|uniref:Lipoprotein n=1 Tax=Sphingomonas kaistensis TaxID=298708 RepID=A0A7X5Y638_9SPHN|nr:hypothetical protein [Sphingomonas kaistensis]NJC05433.1 hypothetical protein [Sphingomonas kaistensis]